MAGYLLSRKILIQASEWAQDHLSGVSCPVESVIMFTTEQIPNLASHPINAVVPGLR